MGSVYLALSPVLDVCEERVTELCAEAHVCSSQALQCRKGRRVI